MAPTSSDRLVVAGFHRSGTSVVARLLHEAGLDLGPDLIGSRASNPDGHFEDVAAVRLHDDLLGRAGVTWRTDRPDEITPDRDGFAAMAAYRDARDAAARPWGFKDPRATHFLGAWRKVLDDPALVIVVRRPDEATTSLRRREARRVRNGARGADALFADPGLALRMWVAAHRILLAHAGEALVVTHEALMDGYPLVDAVGDRFGIALRPVATLAVVEPGIAAGGPLPVRGAASDLAAAHDLYRRLAAQEVAHVR